MTPKDLIDIGKNIYKVRTSYYADDDRVSEISKKDQEILNKLGVDLLRKNS